MLGGDEAGKLNLCKHLVETQLVSSNRTRQQQPMHFYCNRISADSSKDKFLIIIDVPYSEDHDLVQKYLDLGMFAF
jgi:hypothetical protein